MSIYQRRQTRLYQAIQNARLDGLALNPGSSLVYLTGLHFHLMERPVVVLFIPGQTPQIVLPELEGAKLSNVPFDVQAHLYDDDPLHWNKSFQSALRALEGASPRIGVEPTQLRFLELRFIESAAPNIQFISAEEPLAELRLCKEESEIAAMRKAVKIAQNALLATLPNVKIGVSERELASELTLQTLRAGSDPLLPFTPIVASGPNSANPHSVPSERVLIPGDLLLFDWGAAYEGYISDLTRTFAIQHVEDELKHIAKVVGQANAAGRAAARPGVTAESVDRAARSIIEEAGYGERFFHRTGHGIGMESHEAPYIRSGNKMILQAGMAFTIEPGIYLPGRGGVRIEDNVIIGTHDVEILSDLPRDLEVLA